MRLHYIPKNKKTQINEHLEASYRITAGKTKEALYMEYNSRLGGLSEEEAQVRLAKEGPNTTSNEKRKSALYFMAKSFMDTFILVLLALAVISVAMQDILGCIIILILAIISAFIRFFQDYQAYLAGEKLKKMIHTQVNVRRKGKLMEVPIETLVRGDIVELGSGSLIPADLVLIDNKDLFLGFSLFTGESAPIERMAGTLTPEETAKESSISLKNICLMGATVVSGSGVGMVFKTGLETYLGHISTSVESIEEKTAFDLGMAQITKTLIYYMSVVAIGVFVLNGFIRKDWINAFMFAVAVAVGITPGMLPMIVNSTLSKGAQFLAKKKTIVKNISAIENLGSMNVLCTDKTGTLTIDKVQLQRYMNIDGVDERSILDTVYLNSYFGTGIKNLIDRAILDYGETHGVKADIEGYVKIDEIPFDYDRKCSSVVIADKKNEHRLITKGAIEEILKICNYAKHGDEIWEITPEISMRIVQHADQLNEEGMHVIGVCEKNEAIDAKTFGSSDENKMTFVGYIGFLDPPKPDVAKAIAGLNKAEVSIKVLTGDAPKVAQHICREIGMKTDNILTGIQIESMDDLTLLALVEKTDIFARLAPMQKQRVVLLLKQKGYVVGYMGDGVNDAPALRAADVGISVDSATDIAKESADIILLEKSLSVLQDGVEEGRRTYGNIMKYMKMSLSSNFGNVFSVLAASIFLPFLPMLPIQMLIQNLIYDLTQVAIPWDRVEPEFLEKPKKWDTHGLSRFMNVLGVTSSVFDVFTFAALWFVLGYNTPEKQIFFQTGWFIEGLFSQTLIVHFIRTSKIAFIQSCGDIRLIFASLGGLLLAILTPIVLSSIGNFHFTIMPKAYYLFLCVIIISYALTVEIVKKFYLKQWGEWL